MTSLEMSLGLRNRSKVNWVQNNTKIDKHSVLSMSPDHMIHIKFTETIQNILKMHVALNNYLDKN